MHYDDEKKEFSYDEDVLAIFTDKKSDESNKQEVDRSEIVCDQAADDSSEKVAEKTETDSNDIQEDSKMLEATDEKDQIEEVQSNAIDTNQSAEEDTSLNEQNQNTESSSISDGTVVFASEPNGEESKETVLFAAAESKNELGSGLGEAVIDREEWDKIIAEVDAQQASKEAEESEKAKKQGEKKMTKKKNKKKKKGHFWRNFLLAILALCLVGAIALGVIIANIVKETPEINPDNIYDLLSENSLLLDSNGVVIDNIYQGGSLRTNVEYSDMPQDLIWALVCTEDKTFFTHNGFNIVRIFGAIWDTVKSGFAVRIGGTSTITQQLARNVYLTSTMSARGIEGVKRKIQEAYYTVLIEKALTKEQIIEAYLNTIYLGFNSDGVQAAAQAYFNKDVKDLSLVECAVLATLPQSPNKYAPLKRAGIEDFTEDELQEIDIVAKTESWVTYYNDAIESRVSLVLRNMLAQGHLDQETYDSIDIHESVRTSLNPGSTIESAEMASSYFKDYIIDVVVNDLQTQLGYTYDEASDLLYTGGLIINSTLDLEIQNIIEDVYSNVDNFPNIKLTNNVETDRYNNICYTNTRNIMLYEFHNMFDENDDFTLKRDEYEMMPNGDLKILKGKRLGIYKTQVGNEIEIACEFKNVYVIRDKELYTRSGGYWNIPSKYKQRDDDGNMILSHEYFADEPDAFKFNDDGTITLSKDYFVLRDEVIQPQSAMVIIESSTGAIRGMIGGRNITGKKLYNRAIKTRQTGSSIKPIAVYAPALQLGYNNAKQNAEMLESGQEFTALPVYTAATPLDDIPMNMNDTLWPYEFDLKFRGSTWLRYAVQQSLNCCSVSLFTSALSPWDSITTLQNLGITSIVTSGDANDVNAAALALGGFTNGVSPLEMCSAYSTFGNGGEHVSAICYTTVTNKKGDVILSAVDNQTRTQVFDKEVSDLVMDILHSVVYGGGASGAKLKTQSSGGKTGTTNDNYDIWFCGLTPKYSATVWCGSDMNLYINGSSSSNATKLFRLVMDRVGALDEKAEFTKDEEMFVTCTIDSRTGLLATEDTPEDRIREEIFIVGTEPTEYSSPEVTVDICRYSGYLATDECRMAGHAVSVTYLPRVGGLSWETLLASYTIYEEYEIQFTKDGKQYIVDVNGETCWYDKENNVYKNAAGEVVELRYLVEDKSAYLDLPADVASDPPEFYCPYHNHDTETYPISPLAEYKVVDPSQYEQHEDPSEEPSDEPVQDEQGNGGNEAD